MLTQLTAYAYINAIRETATNLSPEDLSAFHLYDFEAVPVGHKGAKPDDPNAQWVLVLSYVGDQSDDPKDILSVLLTDDTPAADLVAELIADHAEENGRMMGQLIPICCNQPMEATIDAAKLTMKPVWWCACCRRQVPR